MSCERKPGKLLTLADLMGFVRRLDIDLSLYGIDKLVRLCATSGLLLTLSDDIDALDMVYRFTNADEVEDSSPVDIFEWMTSMDVLFYQSSCTKGVTYRVGHGLSQILRAFD